MTVGEVAFWVRSGREYSDKTPIPDRKVRHLLDNLVDDDTVHKALGDDARTYGRRRPRWRRAHYITTDAAKRRLDAHADRAAAYLVAERTALQLRERHDGEFISMGPRPDGTISIVLTPQQAKFLFHHNATPA